MIDRAVEFTKQHAYDTVLALFILVFGGSIIGLWNTFTNALVEYPAALCLACGLSFLLGLLVAALRDRRTATLKQIEENTKLEIERLDREERRRAQEKEEAERQQREREAERKRMDEVRRIFRKRIMEMDFELKSVLFYIYSNTCVELHWIDPCMSGYLHEETFEGALNCVLDDIRVYGFVKYETTAPDVRKWTLCEGVFELIRDNVELFSRVPKDFDEIKELIAPDY